MFGIALAEAVLRAMGLIGDYDDVATIGEHGMRIALRLRREFLDGREDDSAGRAIQQLANFRASVGTLRGLGQNPSRREHLSKKLVIKIVAVSDEYQRRVSHVAGPH